MSHDPDLQADLDAQAKSDLNTATIRTAIPAAWTGIALWAISKTNLDIDLNDITTLTPALLVVGGIVYRLARAIEARWPKAAYIFLGSNKTPAFYESN